MTNQTCFYYYLINNLSTDTIDVIGGLSTGGVSVANLISALPGTFWIESDVNGEDALCTTKLVGKSQDLTVNLSGSVYVAKAIPFVAIPDQTGIVGPHPAVIFKPGPRK